MNGLLIVLSNSKISHWLPWKQKCFIFAYKNNFILINFACLLALTILRIQLLKLMISDQVFDFYGKMMRKLEEKMKFL